MNINQSERISTAFFLTAISISLISNHAVADSTFLLDDTVPAFSSDGLNNGDALTVDGIDLIFSNVVVSDGSSNGDVEGAGILISGFVEPDLTDVVSFDISFSQDVIIDSYDIGSREDIPPGSVFTVIGINGSSGANAIPSGSSFSEVTLSFAQGSIPFFIAGEVYSFSHNLTTDLDSLFNLEQIVVVLVPEPSTTILLFVGTVGFMRRRC